MPEQDYRPDPHADIAGLWAEDPRFGFPLHAIVMNLRIYSPDVIESCLEDLVSSKQLHRTEAQANQPVLWWSLSGVS